MCTGLIYKRGEPAFMGRNYDCEILYDENVTVSPRNYLFNFNNLYALDVCYVIMGITPNIRDYPLYYAAVNEKGLARVGLNFAGNAHYTKPDNNKINLSSFELIFYTLSNYRNLKTIEK